MIPGELFPIASGVLVALALRNSRPASRPWVGALFSVVFGAVATLVSQEFQLSWGFFLIDTALVAAAAKATLVLIERVRLWRRV